MPRASGTIGQRTDEELYPGMGNAGAYRANPNMQPVQPYQAPPTQSWTNDQIFNSMGPQSISWLLQSLAPSLTANENLWNGQRNNLLNYLNTYTLGSATQPLYAMLNQMNQNPLAGNQLLGQLSNQAMGYASGQTQMPYGQNVNNLINGTGGSNWGLDQFYNYLLNSGLPNQGIIEGMVNPQTQYGNQMQGNAADILSMLTGGQNVGSNPLQNQLSDQLSAFIQGGGITPEYAQAQRELVLDPSQEALTGRLNQLAGGEASLASPAYQEMLRRNEQDFNNQLLSQGYNNLQGFMSQAGNLGAQQFGQGTQLAGMGNAFGNQALQNALQAYGIVPQTVAPFSSQASNLATSLGQMGQYGQNSNVQNLATLQNMALQPYQFLQNQQQMAWNAGSGLLNQLLGANMGMNDQLLRQYLGQLGISSGLTSDLTNMTARERQIALMSQMQNEQLRNSVLGQLFGGIANSGINSLLGWLGLGGQNPRQG